MSRAMAALVSDANQEVRASLDLDLSPGQGSRSLHTQQRQLHY